MLASPKSPWNVVGSWIWCGWGLENYWSWISLLHLPRELLRETSLLWDVSAPTKTWQPQLLMRLFEGNNWRTKCLELCCVRVIRRMRKEGLIRDQRKLSEENKVEKNWTQIEIVQSKFSEAEEIQGCVHMAMAVWLAQTERVWRPLPPELLCWGVTWPPEWNGGWQRQQSAQPWVGLTEIRRMCRVWHHLSKTTLHWQEFFGFFAPTCIIHMCSVGRMEESFFDQSAWTWKHALHGHINTFCQ